MWGSVSWNHWAGGVGGALFSGVTILGWIPSFAGDYHVDPWLLCSDCHVMHSSQSHPYGDGQVEITSIGTSGPYTYLLRDHVNDLCLSCHDAKPFAPDVFEEHGRGYPRQAGALNEVSGTGQYPPDSGHTLGSTDVAPGSDPLWSAPEGLRCTDCHSPHGTGLAGNSYRNLGGFGTIPGPASAISYARGDVEGPNDLDVWVYEDRSQGVISQHYAVSAITFNEPDPAGSAYADFCRACHHDFHGELGGTEIGGNGVPLTAYLRHPSAGAEVGAASEAWSLHSNLAGRFAAFGNQVQVLSPTGQRAGDYGAADPGLTPSCMSCHRGHGNRNAFGLIHMSGSGAVTEEGVADKPLENLCAQCHGSGDVDLPWAGGSGSDRDEHIADGRGEGRPIAP